MHASWIHDSDYVMESSVHALVPCLQIIGMEAHPSIHANAIDRCNCPVVPGSEMPNLSCLAATTLRVRTGKAVTVDLRSSTHPTALTWPGPGQGATSCMPPPLSAQAGALGMLLPRGRRLPAMLHWQRAGRASSGPHVPSGLAARPGRAHAASENPNLARAAPAGVGGHRGTFPTCQHTRPRSPP